MEKYETMPDQLVAGWVSEDVEVEPEKTFDLHYHQAEEWLRVLKGEMTFYSWADACSFPLGKGQALNIPQGEVHRVEIGRNSVTYRMWTPVRLPEPFSRTVTDELKALIVDNMKIPETENLWNSRDASISIEAQIPEIASAGNFLGDFVSEDLAFQAASGKTFTKDTYLERPPSPDVWRFSSGSVCILDSRDDAEAPLTSLVLSTLVHTREKGRLQQSSFVNLRSFVREPGRLRCRIWLNYPAGRSA